MKPARIAIQEVISVVLLIALFVGVTALLPADLTLARRLPDQEKQAGFSGLPFVAPSVADPQVPALYWVAGNNPVELLPLTGMTTNDKVEYRLSPDGQTIALLLQKSADGSSSVELVRRSDVQRLLIAKGVDKQITSLAWVNDQQIAYTKVAWSTENKSDNDVLKSVFKVAKTQLSAGAVDQAVAPKPESEVWLSNLDGTQQRLLIKAPLYRILGLSPDAQTLYATTLRPGAEMWRMEEFALVNTKTGAVEKPWASQFAAKWFYGFKLVNSPNQTPQVIFFEGETPGGTVLRKPPAIWVGDLNTHQAQKVWEVTHSFAGPKNTTVYYLPSDFSWGPDTQQEFAYVMNHQLWRVNLKEKAETKVREADRILAWNEQGLAVDAGGDLILSDRDGQARAEIQLATSAQAGALAPAAAVVNYNVPFVHQVYDTPDAFNGNWACGPTSAVMALAYFQKIATHPIQISIPTPHYNDYGWYVSEQYTYQSACTGAHVFDRQQPDASGNMARGAYGSCTTDGYAYNTLINTYVGNHDLTSSLDYSPSASEVQAALQNGSVVILGTYLTGAGHLVVARGYNDNGTFIINDPYGNGSDGSFDGSNVTYTWSQMSVSWSLAVGPQSTCASSGTFSNLSANLQGTGSATFQFSYSGTSSSYYVDMSIDPNLGTGTYLNFAQGAASPLVEPNPRKWDQYTCGRTFYWRVYSSTGAQSAIQTAQVSCSGSSFSNLSAVLHPTESATFRFTYSGTSSQYRVDLSTDPTMNTDVYGYFAFGAASPLVAGYPLQWDKYTCGRTLYWRVVSSTGVQSAIQTASVASCPAGSFSNLSANLSGTGSATFQFAFSGTPSPYRVDMSINSNMTTGVYMRFVTGSASPLVEPNPRKWDQYTCGRTLYWRVLTASGAKSPIQTAQVACSGGTYSNLSADLQAAGSATFRFSYSGSSSYYRIHMSINPNMVNGVYWNFGGGTASPVVEPNPRKWDQYTCGHTLYWWVESSTGINSPIQTAQVSACSGGGTSPMTGHGFDACTAPSLSHMQAWMTGSPYRYVGIYIGGLNRSCDQPNLTSSWVSSAAAQGWKFIPTWVGYQAPCANSVYGTKMSSDTTVAYSQGTSEAQSAVNAANALGFSNSVIYYDMERYDENNTTCIAAVQSFMNGWVGRLRALGYKAGVYASPCNLTQLTSISQVPDAVWGANWYYPSGQAGYISTASAYGMACLGDSYWNHQRLRQYSGNYTENWNGWSLNIDADVADGPVAIRTALASQNMIQSMDLLTENEGWVLANQQLFWTKDAGKQWNKITPALAEGATVDAAFFIDAQNGWVMSQADGRFNLFKTSDGGTTWRQNPLAVPDLNQQLLQPDRVQLNFLDTKTGWVVIKSATGVNFSHGVLLGTQDGGETWTQLSIPLGEPVHFVSAKVGWIAGGPAGDQFYKTVDGGHTWQPQQISSLTEKTKRQIKYGFPVFRDEQNGTLPVMFLSDTQNEVVFYTTQDGGRSWMAKSSKSIGRSLILDTLSSIATTEWLAESGKTLSDLPGAKVLDFVTADSGWAYLNNGVCSGDTCQVEQRLVKTSDGGKTWTEMVLPGWN